jgi:hypothetical protein
MDEVWNTCLRFERFVETGEKYAFRLRSGQEFLGWVMEVGEDAILVAWAPSPFYAQATGTEEMSPPDEWVRFADIEPSSLAYWDDAACRWIDFPEAEPGKDFTN